MAITQDYVAWATGNDYKGATFTDGAFTVADMTLTKAGAFAASKANHWLYLTDNGSGNVTAGYYRIASVTSANAVVLATSPKSGATDPTDVKCAQHDGTTSLPWRSDQGAVDLCTRNTTDGNQVNIKAGTAVVHVAALDLTTLNAGGAISSNVPFVMSGYTSTANDGGIGEIDCGGATMIASTYCVGLKDLELHTFGDNHGISIGEYSSIVNCEVHKGASTPSAKYAIQISLGTSQIIGCYIHDYGTGCGVYMNTARNIVYGNYIENMRLPIYITGNPNRSDIINNIIVTKQTDGYGIYCSNSQACAIGNIIYNTTAGTSQGILTNAYRYGGIYINNIICGWSGAGGEGIDIVANSGTVVVGNNAFYNNTANYTYGEPIAHVDLTANDVSLDANPFTDAANGDFSLTAAAKTALAAKGFPTSYLGAHANTVPNLNIGPIQMAAGGGSSIFRRVARLVGG